MDKDIKFKHLDYIQSVITRMNHCSFLLKGWSVTLVAALFALAAKDADIRFICMAYLPALAFWILDGFFLNQERRYRDLYALVIKDNPSVPELSMDTTTVESIKREWVDAIFSKSLVPFHGTVLLGILLVMGIFSL